MNKGNKGNKNYDPFSIFEEFYEIEYDSSPIPGAGKFVLKSQKIEPPVRDEVRDIFDRMRDIARGMKSYAINNSRFYDKRVQHENAKIFYEQGMFMKDFEDYYSKKITCSAYYPRYQMMGYDQLRTYFTWRTEVREGYVEKTSTSYAFMYIYELLNNIGVEDPLDGLEKLMFFWKEYRNHDHTVDKYVLKWLKDYHIYYELPQNFREFVEENGLEEYYPRESDVQDIFERYCTLSKYDIRTSKFYPEREELIRNCFAFLMDRLEAALAEKGMNLEEFLFVPVDGMPAWEPFSGALFHPWLKQRDRRVEFSGKEIYICSENRWFVHQKLTTESGRTLLGYCMKQMEVVLRELTKYKYRITAGIAMVRPAVTDKLTAAGIDLEKVVTDAVKEYYRESTKIVVKVNLDSLAMIRQEAFETQEKLIVQEEESQVKANVPEEEGTQEQLYVPEIKASEIKEQQDEFGRLSSYEAAEGMSAAYDLHGKNVKEPMRETGTGAWEENGAGLCAEECTGPWAELRNALNQVELEALSILVNDPVNIRKFAAEQGIMPEVLMDGINEKAYDAIGDSLFDEEFVIYDDYIEDVKEMVK